MRQKTANGRKAYRLGVTTYDEYHSYDSKCETACKPIYTGVMTVKTVGRNSQAICHVQHKTVVHPRTIALPSVKRQPSLARPAPPKLGSELGFRPWPGTLPPKRQTTSYHPARGFTKPAGFLPRANKTRRLRSSWDERQAGDGIGAARLGDGRGEKSGFWRGGESYDFIAAYTGVWLRSHVHVSGQLQVKREEYKYRDALVGSHGIPLIIRTSTLFTDYSKRSDKTTNHFYRQNEQPQGSRKLHLRQGVW